MGMENLTPTGFRSPDRPTASASQCRLLYASPLVKNWYIIISYFTSVRETAMLGHGVTVTILLFIVCAVLWQFGFFAQNL
jgi:hypothetical protein